MTYRGRVRNSVIVLTPPAALPEGAEVEVFPTASSGPTWAEVLEDIIGKAEGLPPDMARNHDHYIHGAPKQ